MNQTSSKYLSELEHAEHNILSRFDEFIINIADFLGSMSISSRLSWFLIELPTQQLVPSIIGEVDIIAGRLEFAYPDELRNNIETYAAELPQAHPGHHFNYCTAKLAFEGGLKWPPSLDYLVGIEVKSSFLPVGASTNAFDEFKSKKDSPRKVAGIRLEVEKLLKMGFDRVGLFEFLANPPSDGPGSQPWTRAASLASSSVKVMEQAYANRLAHNSPVGHGACSIGGVIGKDEVAAGAISPRLFRVAQDNPFLKTEETKLNRQIMEQRLLAILERLPQPRTLPSVYVYVKDTRQIAYVNQGKFSL